MIAQEGSYGLERMPDEAESWRQMSHWLQDERLLAYYGGASHRYSVRQAERQYRPRVRGEEPGMTPCFLVLDGRRVGYIQFYPVHNPSDYQMPGEPNQDVWAMDLFIAAAESWGKGHGRRFISLTLAHLFDVEHAREVWIDPHLDNARAIKAYERCGFRKHKVLEAHEEHDGVMCDAWLMRCERDVFESTRA